MIDALSRLLRRGGPGGGNASCATPEAPTAACPDGDTPPPSTDDNAAPKAPLDEEIELMRYLLLSMAAAY
ncbi:hypothetical protein [Paraburkholderia youngii]|uniref:hypothetical protein n=1 Tax=Paraburkholderia youngii TaxID=2782701 RepID=UPI003D20C7A3